jgi:hypothetical protein
MVGMLIRTHTHTDYIKYKAELESRPCSVFEASFMAQGSISQHMCNASVLIFTKVFLLFFSHNYHLRLRILC